MITKIRLPKSNGTCTRCPFEIRTYNSEEYSATIKIKIYEDQDKHLFKENPIKIFDLYKDDKDNLLS